MPVTDAFLNTCRTLRTALPELTAFNAALASYTTASDADKGTYWNLAFRDAQVGLSLANRLKVEIRNIVQAQRGSPTTLSDLDCESAYRTLASEVITDVVQPLTDAQEDTALNQLLREQLMGP